MLRLAETTMSDPYLPAEMLDHIVDHLHDTPDALRNCSLVSKSWIPRTRRHLFADISFPTTRSVRSWKKSFPDPANSPARYAKTLYFGSDVVAAADAEVGGWIRGFLPSCIWSCSFGDRFSPGRPLSSHSTDSHPPEIPPHGSRHFSVLADFQPHSFVPSSRGHGREPSIPCVA
jgi:hypothetical protein